MKESIKKLLCSTIKEDIIIGLHMLKREHYNYEDMVASLIMFTSFNWREIYLTFLEEDFKDTPFKTT